MIISLEEKRGGFVPNTTYCFNPPVKTTCLLVNGQSGWTQKFFSKGWCLKYEKGEGIFQGKPLNEKFVHFFKVTYGSGGSKAIETKAPAKA
ncbi:hypothetical protein KAU09_03635 [Candidatus Parcubacteria bacterium]|nr:hypothetical protein [Candidatus Parcubacteria bacterium]